MYLIKRKYDNFFTYAYEPSDQVLLLNALALSNWGNRDPNQTFTVKHGRSRQMERNKVSSTIYEIQENKANSGITRVASFEITPVKQPTSEEYKILVTEWEKHEMINLLLRGVDHGITD